MARIRAIKPEFWSSPGIESLDPYARLLYVAMWNWADDNGNGVANARELLGFAFPLDEEITVADLRRWLVDITRVFGVIFYTVAGRSYYSIPSWEKHQKFDRRSKGKYPDPDEADSPEVPANKGKRGHSTESHESTSSPRADSVAGIGEQGRVEQGRVDTSPLPQFDQFWDLYPRKVGKPDALKAYEKAAKTHGEQIIIAGVQRLQLDPNLPERNFIPHPATWLNREGWNDEPFPARNRPTDKPSTEDKMRNTIALAQALQAAASPQAQLQIEGARP